MEKLTTSLHGLRVKTAPATATADTAEIRDGKDLRSLRRLL